jgi:hypothetical protein
MLYLENIGVLKDVIIYMIILLGLPKSGTSSFQELFEKLKI